MNAAAKAVVTELPDITIAYGVSDEYRSVSCPDVWSVLGHIAHDMPSVIVSFSTRRVHCSNGEPGKSRLI